MKLKVQLSVAAATLSLLFVSCTVKEEKFHNIPLTEISSSGWLKTMLEQEKDFASELKSDIYPFTQGGWGTDPFLKNSKTGKVGFWVPYEQTAYYYDGLLRCGLLLKDTSLVTSVRDVIYSCISNAGDEGVIESVLSGEERSRWPHAVFFRAWMAYYEATGDSRLLDAMEAHFLKDTVNLAGRDMCNIEAMAWLYDKTGNEELYEKVIHTYESRAVSSFKEDMAGGFLSDKKQEVHGVTYNEMLKLPIVMFELTGEDKYLDEARNGFAKLDKYHMLPDGVNSSEEGTSGKGARNTHETCNVIDYMWTCSYMLKATGETEWADRMERALFNAGMGSITKEFDAHQYYSCPNQVYCDEHSSHVLSYEDSRLSYRLVHKPPCCTGNLTRMFPVYIGNQWLQGSGNTLIKALYGPGSVTHRINGKMVVVEEKSVYPYTDDIKLEFSGDEAEFVLSLRVPGWCTEPEIKVNGEKMPDVRPAEMYDIERTWKPGDIVSLFFPKTPEFINWDGYESMVVNYGPMLFALPVEADIEKTYISNPVFKSDSYLAYRMNPVSDWNYILGVDGTDPEMITVEKSDSICTDNPWAQEPQAIRLKVPAYKDPTWKESYHKVTDNSGKDCYAPETPPLPARGAMIFVLRRLKPEVISLVPYGSTELRISMFPFWKETEIAPEVLATE